MGDSYFEDLKRFNKKHDSGIALYYANMMQCIQRDMMYNHDTAEKIPRRVFNTLLNSGDISEYSTNPDYPVCGNLSNYEVGIGKNVLNFGMELNTLVARLQFVLSEAPDLIQEFAQQLYFLKPGILQALRKHPRFHTMSRKEIWEELFRFSAVMKFEEVKIPIYLHLDRIYMETLLPRNDIYCETVDENMEDVQMMDIVHTITAEQEIGLKTTVCLHRGAEIVFYDVRPSDDGYFIEKQASKHVDENNN